MYKKKLPSGTAGSAFKRGYFDNSFLKALLDRSADSVRLAASTNAGPAGSYKVKFMRIEELLTAGYFKDSSTVLNETDTFCLVSCFPSC